jgi:radical SAM protein with 4Fe4S-binding SPASM domain
MSLVAGNLRDRRLSEIWEQIPFFGLLRSLETRQLQGICGNCMAASVCRGMCRVNAFAVYGSLLAPYPFCQMVYREGCFPEYALVDPDAGCDVPAHLPAKGRDG